MMVALQHTTFSSFILLAILNLFWKNPLFTNCQKRNPEQRGKRESGLMIKSLMTCVDQVQFHYCVVFILGKKIKKNYVWTSFQLVLKQWHNHIIQFQWEDNSLNTVILKFQRFWKAVANPQMSQAWHWQTWYRILFTSNTAKIHQCHMWDIGRFQKGDKFQTPTKIRQCNMCDIGGFQNGNKL